MSIQIKDGKVEIPQGIIDHKCPNCNETEYFKLVRGKYKCKNCNHTFTSMEVHQYTENCILKEALVSGNYWRQRLMNVMSKGYCPYCNCFDGKHANSCQYNYMAQKMKVYERVIPLLQSYNNMKDRINHPAYSRYDQEAEKNMQESYETIAKGDIEKALLIVKEECNFVEPNIRHVYGGL